MNVTIKSYRKEREQEIISGLQIAMEKVGALVERQAKSNIIANSAKNPWERTGQTASSVTHNVKVEGNEIYTEIGIPDKATTKDGKSVAKVGKWLELGHSQHPGQYVPAIGKRLVASDVPPYPWLFPAVEANRDKIIELLKKSGGKGISITGG